MNVKKNFEVVAKNCTLSGTIEFEAHIEDGGVMFYVVDVCVHTLYVNDTSYRRSYNKGWFLFADSIAKAKIDILDILID